MAKKALLIGCNYPGMIFQLNGCVNDVWRMHGCLVEQYGFLEEDITVLIDTDDKYTVPTGKNIRDALSALVNSASAGDILFVHFSGHGLRMENDDPSFIQAIVPNDFNLVTDVDFRAFVQRDPEKCKITIVCDSCHGGGLIKGAKNQIEKSSKIPDGIRRITQSNLSQILTHQDEIDYSYVKVRSLSTSVLIDSFKEKYGKDDIDENLRYALVDIFGRENVSPMFVELDLMSTQSQDSVEGGILLSACQSDQVAIEGKFKRDEKVYGMFSNYMHDVIGETKGVVANKELVLKTRDELKKRSVS